MEFIMILIGRLVAGEPMSAAQWIAFRYDVIKALRPVVRHWQTEGAWMEISSGTTEWRGRSEPCAMFTLMNVPLSVVPLIKRNLAHLPARYGQDAIGVRYGTADLITPTTD